MVEFEMQGILWTEFTKKVPFMFANIFFLYGEKNFEMDFCCVDDNGLFIEYEIKCSKKDFIEEFKAKQEKHAMLKNRDPTCPNQYYFVALPGIISRFDVPEYAGLIEMVPQSNNTYKKKIIRKAPILHQNRFNVKDLFYKIYYRYFNCEAQRFSSKRKRIRKADGSKAKKEQAGQENEKTNLRTNKSKRSKVSRSARGVLQQRIADLQQGVDTK